MFEALESSSYVRSEDGQIQTLKLYMSLGN